MVDQTVAFLRARGAAEAGHSGRSLLDHLLGTHQVLQGWLAEPATCLAGLCHSVYGTSAREPALLGPDERPALRAVIGEPAEALVHLFSRCQPTLLPDAVRGTSPLLDPEWTALEATRAQVRELGLIALANLVEQAPRTSGLTAELVDDLSDSLGTAMPGRSARSGS